MPPEAQRPRQQGAVQYEPYGAYMHFLADILLLGVAYTCNTMFDLQTVSELL